MGNFWLSDNLWFYNFSKENFVFHFPLAKRPLASDTKCLAISFPLSSEERSGICVLNAVSHVMCCVVLCLSLGCWCNFALLKLKTLCKQVVLGSRTPTLVKVSSDLYSPHLVLTLV